MALRVKSYHACDFRNRVVGRNQQCLCLPDFTAQGILHGGIAQHILKGMGNVGFAQSKIPANILEGNRFMIITMPTVTRSAQIGMKECRQTVTFLVKLR